jgi:hypothetical protein
MSIRIRIPNTDADIGQPNQGGSIRIWINNTVHNYISAKSLLFLNDSFSQWQEFFFVKVDGNIPLFSKQPFSQHTKHKIFFQP